MRSPLIQDGDFQLTINGQWVSDLTLKTQLNTTVVGYDCYYGDTFESTLLSYLANPEAPNQQNQKQTIANIVKNAYQVLIQQGYITNLSIYVLSVILNYVNIRTVSTDARQNEIETTWSN